MSFFRVERASSALSDGGFSGLLNYRKVFSSLSFVTSMENIAKIWVIGGVVVMVLALMLAVILTSGIRFKRFYRAMIYMPNIISAVALASMWTVSYTHLDVYKRQGINTTFPLELSAWASAP